MSEADDPSTAPDRTRLLTTLLSFAVGPARIAIVSPQAVVRYGLRQLVTYHVDGARLVGPDDSPDVLLYDLAELDQSGLEGLERLRSQTGAIVVAVSLADTPELAARAVAAGVDGYVRLGLTEDEWLEDVGAIVLERLARERAGVAYEPRADEVSLTDRENDVLRLIAQGRSNQEIAEALGVGANSIKSYIRTAYKKIGAASRSQAVSWTLRHGLVGEQPPEG